MNKSMGADLMPPYVHFIFLKEMGEKNGLSTILG